LDLLDPLSSSSLLEEYEDDEEELDAEDLLECYKSRGNEDTQKKLIFTKQTDTSSVIQHCLVHWHLLSNSPRKKKQSTNLR